MSEFGLRFITSLVAGSIFFGTYFFIPQFYPILLVLILFFILYFEIPKFFVQKSPVVNTLLLLYPAIPFACLLILFWRYYEISKLIPIYPFLIAWGHDIGAYVVGNMLGKHKIAPNISPKKTWEGLAGGFFIVLVINFLLTFNISLYLLSSSLTLNLLAFLGDLLESYLKRNAQLKDSGSLLPGHGGLLDRFDSVFLVTIFITAVLIFSEISAFLIWKSISRL